MCPISVPDDHCKMRLSVIIPCLKYDERVERAVQSVKDSLVDQDIELEMVVVNGISPVGKARNEGLRRATGDYIAWVDSDDEVMPGWGAALADGIRRGFDVMVMGLTHVGWPGRVDVAWPAPCGTVDVERLVRDVYRNMHLYASLVLMVTRRELWTGAEFDEEFLIGEDYLVLPKVLQRARSCLNLGKILYRYYQTPGSLMADGGNQKLRDGVQIFERRLLDVPEKYLRCAQWGVGVGCYWLTHPAVRIGRPIESWTYARRWIRQNFVLLLTEAVWGKGLSVKDRIGWLSRFVCAATDCWWPLRLKAKRRKEHS